MFLLFFFFFKQKTAYEMRISDWSSDVCSSDLTAVVDLDRVQEVGRGFHFRDDVAHLLVKGFEEILEGDGGRGLQDALELLDEIVGIEKRHAAEEHVDATAARAHLGQRHARQIVVVDVDAARERSEEHTSELQSLMRIS